MTYKKRPKYEEVIDGLRVRVYSTRTEYQVLIGEGAIEDMNADVWVFPHMGGPIMWAHQAVLNHKQSLKTNRKG